MSGTETAGDVVVCASDALAERSFLIVDLCYENEPESAIVLRYQGRAYAYLNRCVHMRKRLDIEDGNLFDEEWNLLRCSLHGLVFDPQSGECLGNFCRGERLCALKLIESDGRIVLRDRRLAPAGI